MAKLYYGQGECNIEGTEIRGVQIHYSGKMRAELTANDHFALMNKNNIVIIFPLPYQEDFLTNLFRYNGSMKINQVIVAGKDGQKVPCSIHRMMDYTELLTSNSEDMTTNSEDLKGNYTSTKRAKVQNVISNLNTTTHDGDLGTADDELYEGLYHIHLKDTPMAMTGAFHTSSSVRLYPMKDGKIIKPTIRKTTNKARRTSTRTSGSKGGSY